MNEQRTTPLKAIRMKCIECSGGSTAEVRECVIPACPLYPFRMGHNPNIKLTDEQKAARAEYLRKSPSYKGEELRESRSEGNYTHVKETPENAHENGRESEGCE